MDLAQMPRELCLTVLSKLDRVTLQACGIRPGAVGIPTCMHGLDLRPQKSHNMSYRDSDLYMLARLFRCLWS